MNIQPVSVAPNFNGKITTKCLPDEITYSIKSNTVFTNLAEKNYNLRFSASRRLSNKKEPYYPHTMLYKLKLSISKDGNFMDKIKNFFNPNKIALTNNYHSKHGTTLIIDEIDEAYLKRILNNSKISIDKLS